jgi:hypothetical protein
MSGLGKWSLGVGLVLMAGYDALYYWTQRMATRREAAKARRKAEQATRDPRR